jgi:hypothetical protein
MVYWGRPEFPVRDTKILVGHREATERPQLEKGGAETDKSRSGIFGGVKNVNFDLAQKWKPAEAEFKQCRVL